MCYIIMSAFKAEEVEMKTTFYQGTHEKRKTFGKRKTMENDVDHFCFFYENDSSFFFFFLDDPDCTWYCTLSRQKERKSKH